MALDNTGGRRLHFKETAADAIVRERVESAAADDLRQFVERYERLEAEKQDIADQQKEVMSEAKARGYCTKSVKKVVKLRAMDADDRAEQDATLDLYRTALGV